jgi:hypothetical protein
MGVRYNTRYSLASLARSWLMVANPLHMTADEAVDDAVDKLLEGRFCG